MTQRCRLALPEGKAAGSKDALVPSPVSVQNYAYLKLLKWDHLHRPFPEVSAGAGCTVFHCVLLGPEFSLTVCNAVVFSF